MIEFKRILHPTDFSNSSAAAAKYASSLAEQVGAELHLLYVIEDALGKIPNLEVGFPPPDEQREETLGQPTQVMRRALGVQWDSALRVVLVTRLGTPANKIIDYAQCHDVDMIVLGTHGRKGVARALMGSVAEAVVRHAHCPVVTVHQSKESQRKASVAAEKEDGTINAEAEFCGRIDFDLTRRLLVRDLVGPAPARPMAVCRAGTKLSAIVRILVEYPAARNVYVVDEQERLQGQVSLSALSEILLFDYQPSRLYPRIIPAITARIAEDAMEPVDVAVREDESLEEVLRKLVPTREEECPVVDEGGRLIGCLKVVDILGRVVSSDE